MRLLICGGLTSSLALVGTSYAAGPGPGTAVTVCGGLIEDRAFAKELGRLDRVHACEHLQARTDSRLQSSALGRVSTPIRSSAVLAETTAQRAANPGVVGRWSAATDPGTQTAGITAVLLHTGKVLLFGREPNDDNTVAFLFHPAKRTGHQVPVPAPIFCGSVTPLSDGRILSVGGADPVPRGIGDVLLFDPATEQWTSQPDTPLGRYYPTSTRLPDGRVVVTAGQQTNGTQNPTVELYTPPAAGAEAGTLSVVGPEHPNAIYPHQLVMRDGRMLQVDRTAAYRLNPSTWTWTTLPSLPVDSGSGAAHLMLPGGPQGSTRVMVIGGLHKNVALAATQKYDDARRAAGWALGSPMPTSRAHMNVVQVPDGSAYGIGGNSVRKRLSPRRQTMRYDPATDTWTNMAVQSLRRAYHSTALLLPDGRIMSAGDNGVGGGGQLIDFYSPPYLFQGRRPRITSAPTQLRYGQRFAITTSGPTATRAVLMAPAATTHANEMNARHVRLAVIPTSGGLRATAPPTSAVAPPGYYMLFVLRPNGVPSVARWVHVGPARG